jgi:hypothetical protein
MRERQFRLPGSRRLRSGASAATGAAGSYSPEGDAAAHARDVWGVRPLSAADLVQKIEGIGKAERTAGLAALAPDMGTEERLELRREQLSRRAYREFLEAMLPMQRQPSHHLAAQIIQGCQGTRPLYTRRRVRSIGPASKRH